MHAVAADDGEVRVMFFRLAVLQAGPVGTAAALIVETRLLRVLKTALLQAVAVVVAVGCLLGAQLPKGSWCHLPAAE